MKQPKPIIGSSGQLFGEPRCLNCNKLVDGITCVGSDRQPDPGDITICIYCGHLMAFSDTLALRELTDPEMIEIAGNPLIIRIQKAALAARTSKDDSD